MLGVLHSLPCIFFTRPWVTCNLCMSSFLSKPFQFPFPVLALHSRHLLLGYFLGKCLLVSFSGPLTCHLTLKKLLIMSPFMFCFILMGWVKRHLSTSVTGKCSWVQWLSRNSKNISGAGSRKEGWIHTAHGIGRQSDYFVRDRPSHRVRARGDHHYSMGFGGGEVSVWVYWF